MFSIVGAFIVFCVALLHVYWGFGGRFWIDRVVPTTDNGVPLFVPSKLATFAVVALLLALSWAMVSDGVTARIINTVFAVIFFLHFVGEFSYVGMFKKHKNSKFARMDTLLYSPLCLFLSVCCAMAVLG